MKYNKLMHIHSDEKKNSNLSALLQISARISRNHTPNLISRLVHYASPTNVIALLSP